MTKDKYFILQKMHEVYSLNEYVKEGNRVFRFEPKNYHLGMARLYKERYKNA